VTLWLDPATTRVVALDAAAHYGYQKPGQPPLHVDHIVFERWNDPTLPQLLPTIPALTSGVK